MKRRLGCLCVFDQTTPGLGTFYLNKEAHGKKIAAYRQLIIDKVTQFLQDADLPKNEKKTASDVDEIIDLETKLANITVVEGDRRNPNELYNLRRLSDMQNLMPLVNWTRYFHSISPAVVHDYFASNPEIIIVEIDFMRRSALTDNEELEITDLLLSIDPRVITNYVYLQYASNWDGEMGERYEDINLVNNFR
ncbi:hypothetical protein ANCDUO_02643 [Ancylostoma duodenale]|uniref:Peptidase M13 N-terminal domain-containing protein n=1 Tax=Ancylostoma duodenale TaxID=51022 RepID=A0A0C2DVW9_9BILA|nr:hypothetical protein ANCDUO_02643 [Ancylostoma duodenale]